MPARHVGAKLKLIPDTRAKKLFFQPSPSSKYFAWKHTDDGAVYPGHEGTAVWTRPDMARAIHGVAMSANGIRTLAEVDDNYISDPNQNIFMRKTATGDYRINQLRAFAAMDGVICSTRKLRDIYFKAFKEELGYAPEMFVARNHIDPETWVDREPMLAPATRLRVGWAGSHQHVWDLRLAAPALRLAYDLGCEVVLIGLDPATHDPEWAKFLPEYTHVGWMSPDEYHRKTINIDIGLCPLVQNYHTDGKSDIKFLEYSMSGAATVAESSPAYNQTIIHGETGLLSSGPDDMGEKMLSLIQSPNLRREMAANAKAWVLENRTIQRNVGEWETAING